MLLTSEIRHPYRWPMDEGTAARRGEALLALGRFEEAERYLRTALAAAPRDTDLLVSLAEALLRQEKLQAAVTTSRTALATDPEHVRAHSVHAAALGSLERYDDALHAVERALALAPEIAALHVQQATFLAGREDFAEALACVDRAVRLDPESSAAAVSRAGILCDLRRFDEAETAVAEALRLDPENAEAHRVHGVIALRRGRSAVHAYRTTLRLDPAIAHGREGLYFALKAHNPLHRWQFRVNSMPRGARTVLLLAPLLLTIVFRQFDDHLWARILLVVVAVLTLASWLAEPLMNAVLLCGRDRHLVRRDARRATYVCLAFAFGAAICAGLSTALAFALVVWAAAAGTIHLLTPGRRKVLWGCLVVGAWLSAAAVVNVVAGAGNAAPVVLYAGAVALFVVRGVAALWVVVFAG